MYTHTYIYRERDACVCVCVRACCVYTGLLCACVLCEHEIFCIGLFGFTLCCLNKGCERKQ